MKTVTVSTMLEAPADVIWAASKTPHAFVHVAKGVLRFPAAERVDRPWRVGDAIQGWTLLFGLIPFSLHRLSIQSIDERSHTVISDEAGGIICTWRHELITTPIDERRCMYTDRIAIDAGSMTPFVAGFAELFYRHRQRRWRSIAPLLAATSAVEATSGADSRHSQP